MREIKCRGKSTRTGKWVYGYFYDQKSINVDFKAYYNSFILTNQEKGAWKEQVITESVGQFAGLKDKNGKEIYEGDIMKIPDLYETPENTSTTYHYQTVIYQEYAFCLGEGNPLYKDHDYVSDECEVVGNIYENQELLKG